MTLKYTRRKAILGIGMGVISSMLPKWIYARNIKQLPNKIVTYLNPETILINRGVSHRIDKAEFDRSGNWRLPYRIWTAIGAGQEDNNQSSTIGFLLIEKNINKPFPGRIAITVKQKILQQGSPQSFQYTNAEIVCKDNDIATPLEWTIEHSIWRSNYKLDYCSLIEKGQIEILSNTTIVKIQVNNVSRPDLRFKPGTDLTSDLTLISALPEMLDKHHLTKRFVLLEKLRLQKDNHLLFRNATEDYTSNNFGALNKIEHRGNGILPFDYWLDGDGRPLFICSLHNAFIYDLKAEEKVEQICATGKRRQYED
jgi:hypothetical protein